MLSVAASTPEIARRLQRGTGIYIANENARDQTVVGGTREAIESLASQLRADRIAAQPLNVPGAFHTPLMAPAQKYLREALRNERLRPARTLFLSSVTNSYTSDPDHVRANLIEQLVSPVRYVSLIERLADDGFGVFVEVGPKQVLTRLNRKILAGRKSLVLATDDPKQGSRQLLRVQAQLECLGAVDGVRTVDQGYGPSAQQAAHGAARFFDATARRREKMRFQAAARRPPALSSAASATPRLPAHSEPDEPPGSETPDHGANGSVATVARPETKPISHRRVTTHLQETPRRAEPTSAAASARDTASSETIRRLVRCLADLPEGWIDVSSELCEWIAMPRIFLHPDELEDLESLAASTDVPLSQLLTYQAAVYPEAAVRGMHAAAVSRAEGARRRMHAIKLYNTAAFAFGERWPIAPRLRTAKGRLSFVSPSLPGQFAGLGGVNAAGLAISCIPLADQPAPGAELAPRMQTLRIKRLLESAADVDTALDAIRHWEQPGNWSILLSDAASARVVLVECARSSYAVREAADVLVATNQSQLLIGTAPADDEEILPNDRLREAVRSLGHGKLTLEAMRQAFQSADERQAVEHPISARSTVCSAACFWGLEGASEQPVLGFQNNDEPWETIPLEGALSGLHAQAHGVDLPLRSPMIAEFHPAGASQAEGVVRLDPVQDIFLRDHKLRGTPLLPAVIALEIFAEAASTGATVRRSARCAISRW
jgi:hypothetical protein